MEVDSRRYGLKRLCLIVAVLFLCVAVEASAVKTLKETRQCDKALPAVADAAFVDNGQIVLMAGGKLFPTGIRGCHPFLDPTGKKIVYTSQTVLSEVKVNPQAGSKKLGVTFGFGGACVMSLDTGKIGLHSNLGEYPVLSPDLKKVAFINDAHVYVVTEDRQLLDIGAGEKAVWISNEKLVLLREDKLYLTDMKGKTKPFCPVKDGVSMGSLGENMQKMFQLINEGKMLYSTNSLKHYKDGQITFGTIRLAKSGNTPLVDYCLTLADENGSVFSAIVGNEMTGVDPSKCDELALNEKGDEAAFIEQGSFDGTAKLYLVQLDLSQKVKQTSLGDAGSIVIPGCVLPYVDSLNYRGGELYASTLESEKRLIPLGDDGRLYCLANSQIDPVQLKMMGLDVKLADIDSIWRISNTGKTRIRITGGHELCVR